jgi:hypothetical protein
MTSSRFERLLPLAGIFAGLCFAAGFPLHHLPGTPSDAGAVRVVHDHATGNALAGIAAALAGAALLYFVVAVRAALRSGEAGESAYSGAAYAGGIVLAGVLGLDACLLFSMVDAAAKGDAASVAAIGWLEADLWVFWSMAASVFLVATGLGGLRTASLPRWLAIVSTVLGVLSLLGPGGLVTFFVFPVWLVVVGLVLYRIPNPGPRHEKDLAVAAASPTR